MGSNRIPAKYPKAGFYAGNNQIFRHDNPLASNYRPAMKRHALHSRSRSRWGRIIVIADLPLH